MKITSQHRLIELDEYDFNLLRKILQEWQEGLSYDPEFATAHTRLMDRFIDRFNDAI